MYTILCNKITSMCDFLRIFDHLESSVWGVEMTLETPGIFTAIGAIIIHFYFRAH